MLAVCTYSSLVLLDPPTLKRPPPTVSPKCTLPSQPTASTWAPDNSALFIAHDNSIRSFDPSGTPRKTLEREHPVAALACKDNGNTIIYSSHDQITVLDAATGAVAYTLDTHSEPVTGLALSNDASLLASTSRISDSGPGAVHVHNLSSASHTVLQGLPSPGTVTACVFHTHTKTKLLLGVDGQLVVYDVTKPNAPLKTVIVEKIPSEVVAITCSPFSKTLVAVGCASGSVHLVDLEKEKGLFRTLPLHAPLTSLVFSPEGAALYAGTENGKVLILDLRALDKPPKSIDIGSEGQRVMCMAVQRKLKPGERTTTSATGLSKRRVGTDTTNLSAESKAASLKSKTSNPKLNAMMSPRFSRTRTISTTASTPAKPSSTLKMDPTKSTPPTPRVSPKPPVPAPMRIRTTSSGTSASSRVTSASSTVSRSTKLSSATSVTSVGISSPVSRKATIGVRKTHTPPKSPLGDNGDTDATTRPFPSPKRSTSPSKEGSTARLLNRVNVPRIRTTSAATSRSTTSSRVPSGSGPARSTLSTTATLSPSSKPRTRTTTSKASAAESQPQAGPSSQSLQFTSPSNTALSLSPIPPVPALPAEFRDGEQLTEINIRWDARTPSPEHDDEEPPDTPLPARMQGKGKQKEVESLRPKTNVLGLGTPELKRWIEAEGPPEGKWEERKIAMVQEPVNDVQIERIEVVGEDDAGGGGSADDARPALETHADRTVRMTVQISPRRPSLNPLAGWAPARSPLNPAAHMPDGSSSSTPANPAHDIFQSLIRDAMYDFRRETKAEIIGLHLDLVRMGRSWRKEMREAFDKWGEELNEVRRENELLRQENERLRRGY